MQTLKNNLIIIFIGLTVIALMSCMTGCGDTVSVADSDVNSVIDTTTHRVDTLYLVVADSDDIPTPPPEEPRDTTISYPLYDVDTGDSVGLRTLTGKVYKNVFYSEVSYPLVYEYPNQVESYIDSSDIRYLTQYRNLDTRHVTGAGVIDTLITTDSTGVSDTSYAYMPMQCGLMHDVVDSVPTTYSSVDDIPEYKRLDNAYMMNRNDFDMAMMIGVVVYRIYGPQLARPDSIYNYYVDTTSSNGVYIQTTLTPFGANDISNKTRYGCVIEL